MLSQRYVQRNVFQAQNSFNTLSSLPLYLPQINYLVAEIRNVESPYLRLLYGPCKTYGYFSFATETKGLRTILYNINSGLHRRTEAGNTV